MTTHDEFSGKTGEEERFIELLSAKWVAQALCAAAELGIFDELNETPTAVDLLAQRLGCQSDPLRRLMRVLAGEGLVEEKLDGSFQRTPLGRKFSNEEHRQLARFLGSRSQWLPWAHLADAIRSGENPFELANGQPLFEYLEAHPDEAELYHAAVDGFTQAQAEALGKLDLFASAKSVVDVGGGRGTLLLELLTRQPHLVAVLFDLPEVVEIGRKLWQERPLKSRLEFQEGSFFTHLPAGHDCYIVKHVIHNWSDDKALEILETTRKAAGSEGTIIVVDELLIPGNRRDLSRFMDLEMFVVTGQGRERSKPEMRRLFVRAGLSLKKTVRLTMSTWAFVLKAK